MIILYYQTSNPAHIQNTLSNFDNYSGDTIFKFLYLKSPRAYCSKELRSSFNNVIRNNKLVKKFSTFFIPNFFRASFIVFYATFWWCCGFRIAIIFKKTKMPAGFLFWFCKYLLKIIFVVELEGDILAEKEYLMAHRSPFSEPPIPSNEAINNTENYCERADKIVVNSLEYSKVLQASFSKSKVIFRPTGVSDSQFRFDEKARTLLRSHYGLDGFITGIYSGGVDFSWQNLTDTVLLANELDEQFNNYKLIVAVPQYDSVIAERIVESFDRRSVCTIVSVLHSEMNSLYCAADFAILLRKDHAMNIHSCPGKVGEYLVSGLPVVITANIGNYSQWLGDKPFAFFVEDSCLDGHDFRLLSQDIDVFVKSHQSKQTRVDISRHSVQEFSIAYKNKSSSSSSWIEGVFRENFNFRI